MYIIYNYIYIYLYAWNDEPLVMRTFPRGSAELSFAKFWDSEAQEVSVPKVRTRAPLAADDRGESQPQVVPCFDRHLSGNKTLNKTGIFAVCPFGHTHLIDGFIMFHIFFQCYILELEWMMIPTDFHDLSRTFEMGGWTPVSSYPGIWGRVS